jgi:hypothetical protein
MPARSELSLDLLTGAQEIARYVGWPVRRIYHAARCGTLPINRVGALLIARRSELDRALSGTAAKLSKQP